MSFFQSIRSSTGEKERSNAAGITGGRLQMPAVPVLQQYAGYKHTGNPAIIQCVGPGNYPEQSPEKKQFKNSWEWWQALIAVADTNDAIYLNNQKIQLFQHSMPELPVEKIRAAVLKSSKTDTLEQVWKEILFKATDEELQQLQVGGRFADWQLIKRQMGEGTEARVYWGFRVGGGPPVAIKIFKGVDDRYQGAFDKEVAAHQTLKEFREQGEPVPNVVNMLDYNTYLKSVVMEFVRGHQVDKLQEHLEAESRRDTKTDKTGEKERIEKIMERMRKKKEEAVAETRSALRKKGYDLADLQDRNIMYDYENNKITFVDISLEEIEKTSVH